MKKQELYQTNCFANKNVAIRHKYEIEAYFNERLISSKILFGQDERGNPGHYVEYTLMR